MLPAALAVILCIFANFKTFMFADQRNIIRCGAGVHTQLAAAVIDTSK
jgi:hypothetical protein